MKAIVKYIMGPLFLGGLVIALYSGLIAYHLRTDHNTTNARANYSVACHLSKSNGSLYCLSIIKKFFNH